MSSPNIEKSIGRGNACVKPVSPAGQPSEGPTGTKVPEPERSEGDRYGGAGRHHPSTEFQYNGRLFSRTLATSGLAGLASLALALRGYGR